MYRDIKHSYFMFYEFDCLILFKYLCISGKMYLELPCSYVFLFVVGVQYSIISVTGRSNGNLKKG